MSLFGDNMIETDNLEVVGLERDIKNQAGG
jgi:hypothetical protein